MSIIINLNICFINNILCNCNITSCVKELKIDCCQPKGEIVHLFRGESDHIFHLHGYSFYVVAMQQYNRSLDKDLVKQMNEEGILFKRRNVKNPVLKDTVVIPKFGVVALRFKADNPGYWMMRDERSAHWTRGLDFVLKVGEEKDFVQAPSDFPKCGSYVGPEYFLI